MALAVLAGTVGAMAGISASAAQAAGIEPIASGVTWVASQSNEVTGYNNATGAVTGQFSYTSSNQLTDPHAVAVTPDGTTALVTSTSGNVNVITGASSSSPSMTNAQSVTTCPTQATCAPYAAAIGPYGGLITDDVNSSGSGWVIPVSVNETTGTATFQNALQVGSNPVAVAITPDGSTALVVSNSTNSIYPVALTSNSPLVTSGACSPAPCVAPPIGSGSVFSNAVAIAITPDGTTAWVVNSGSDNIQAIAINAGGAFTCTTYPCIPSSSNATINVSSGGASPQSIAISGGYAYLGNAYSSSGSGDSVSTVTLPTSSNAGSVVQDAWGTTGGSTGSAGAIAVTPDGSTVVVGESSTSCSSCTATGSTSAGNAQAGSNGTGFSDVILAGSPAVAVPVNAISEAYSPTPALELSQNERVPNRFFARDDGISVPLGNGNDLWLFGDTPVTVANSSGYNYTCPICFVTGSTAAEGGYTAGQIPTDLNEVPTPGQPLSLSPTTSPGQFIGAPNTYLPGGGGSCATAKGAYAARWLSGGALLSGTSDVLVTYNDVCAGPSTAPVSCPSVNTCYSIGGAVSGATQSPAPAVFLTENDGSTWIQEALPYDLNVSSLTAISCVSAEICWAAGSTIAGPTTRSQGIIVVSGNANSSSPTWSVQSPGSGNPMNGVETFTSISCVSNGNNGGYCYAVGTSPATASTPNGTPVLYYFNGSTWTNDTSYLPTQVGSLSSISCFSDAVCWAAGSTTGGQGIVVVSGNANQSSPTWNPQGSVPPISGVTQLGSISCGSNGNNGGYYCYAAGTKASGHGALIYFNGSSWSDQTPTGAPTITSVSCASATSCEAVDQQGNAWTLSGSTWSKTAVDSNAALTSVSCTTASSFCLATDLNGRSFATQDSGSAWTQETPVGGSSRSGFSVEGWGFAEYNYQTNTLDVAPNDVFPPSPTGVALPSSLGLGSPVISGNSSNQTVSLFSDRCSLGVFPGVCEPGYGQAYETTISTSTLGLSNSTNYTLTPLTTDGSFGWAPVGPVAVASSGAGYVMIEATLFGTGNYDVLTAASAAGPWHLETAGILPDCSNPTNFFGCYAFTPHPELSTANKLAITYFDPNVGPTTTSGSPTGHLVGIMANLP